MKKIIFFSFLLINTLISAQITFSEQDVIIQTDALHPESVYTADIDGDGDMDILSASSYDGKIAWYENLDGNGMFGDQQVINVGYSAVKVYAVDIDGDGDIDVLSVSQSYNHEIIAWHENIDGNGVFGSQQIIVNTDTVGTSAIDIYAADIDGDGDIDIISATDSDNKITWYENIDGNGNFSSQHIITTNVIGANSVYATDIDNDGDIDVISSSYNRIYWYENLDGNATFGTQQIIANNGAKDIFAIDIDGDGDVDVISTSGWYENLDGNGTFSIEHVIRTVVDYVESIFVADLDLDGDMDVVNISKNRLSWYENLDGNGVFGELQLIDYQYFGESVFIVDLDDNGQVDIITASSGDNKIGWYKNNNGLFEIQQIITNSANGIADIYTSDIDGDGDMDILSASSYDNKIAWYENLDGNGTFGIQKNIDLFVNRANSVFTADLDGDGDMDVLSTAAYSDTVTWYENLDGNGTFGTPQIINNYADSAVSVCAADIDNDGNIDVISASEGDNKVIWYKNNADGTFQMQPLITPLAYNLLSVYTADVDNDNDIDVVVLRRNIINWYENDGTGTFSGAHTITNDTGHTSISLTDINGDNYIDVLSTLHSAHKVVWYKNNGSGIFQTQQIITSSINYPISANAADFDDDGDIDVIATSTDYDNNKITWYENLDGNGTFGTQQVITNIEKAILIWTADLNNDGNIDVISASGTNDKIVWYKNLGETVNVQEKVNSEFSIFPNPAKSQIEIISQSDIAKIVLYNQMGEMVYVSTDRKIINLLGLNNGVYFCKVQSVNGNFSTYKIIKE